MELFYEAAYRTDARDTDLFDQCRPSALLGYLQETATQAAEAGDFTRDTLLREHHVFWMLARIWYRLERPVLRDRELTIRTWHRGNPGFMMYRDYDIYVDGAPAGEAVSVWVLADVENRKLFRMDRIPALVSGGGGPLCKEKTLQKLRIPPNLSLAEDRRLHYSDTDLNGHVNNSRYADFACDAVGTAHMGADRFVSSMQLGFLAECREGEQLRIHAGQRDGVWYVHGLDREGSPRFDASMTISPLDNPSDIA